MSLLDKLPFFRPRVRPVGSNLERGTDNQSAVKLRRERWFRWSMVAVVVASAIAVFPRVQVYQYTVEVDDIWRQENLHAPFRYAIRKSPDELRRERERVRRETPPIFREVTDASGKLREKREALTEALRGLAPVHRRRKEIPGAASDSIRRRDSLAWRASVDSLRLGLRSSEWDVLLSDGQTERMIRDMSRIIAELQKTGILSVAKDSILSENVTVRTDLTRRQRDVEVRLVWGRDEALREVQSRVQSLYVADPVMQSTAMSLYAFLMEPNLVYDRRASETRWQEQENLIVPSADIVRQNEVIVRRGDLVTEEIHRKLTSLEAERMERSGTSIQWQRLLGQIMVVVGTFLIFYLYLYLLRRPIFMDAKLMLLINLLLMSVILLFGVALRLALVDMYLVPVAVVSILLTVMFDSRAALFATLTLALLGGLLLGFDFGFTFATIFAGTLGIFSVRDIRNRSQFFLSAGLVFIGYLTVLTAGLLLAGTSIERFSDEVVFVLINSVLLLLAYPLLWVFERTFDITTDLTLLELSDTNRPILKKLSMRAPGTFNHVLQVANLAEAAAAAVGANALLTRVGALYHDIGKIVKPEYFVENQRPDSNPHDALKPRMSALIIASHVKEGLDLGRDENLPKEVLQFIPMHHGTTRIEYFYRRALDLTQSKDADVSESDFRYPGPVPNSKETGILMLADSVEAASRSLENPNHKRLESLIDGLVEARREDGQLDDTDLTFKDLKVIKETLLNALLGIYHVRVKYPGEDSSEKITDALDG
ncbi:MAG: metal-dependent phosphohydrolase [Bacteroidetes bacterium CG12_big_fil_rev_8_21_14_0_65_60_17]|nr:MAG: metal-dependent phosphohydrolase [Bacteroidetes bacterium CG12_big_fil_rev_8_21_14_0_65_60_17]